MSKYLEVVEVLLDLVTLKYATRGCNIKEVLDSVLLKSSVPIRYIVRIATNGAPFMTGKTIGFLNVDTSHPDFFICILYYLQRTFSSKIFSIFAYYVVSSTNHELHLVSAKIHWQFISFVEEMNKTSFLMMYLGIF